MNKKLINAIEMLIIQELKLKQRPALAICMTNELDNFQERHWATNVSRPDGIKLFQETAEKMKAQMN